VLVTYELKTHKLTLKKSTRKKQNPPQSSASLWFLLCCFQSWIRLFQMEGFRKKHSKGKRWSCN